MATSNLSLQNWFETTLSSAINATDTTISLNAVPTGTEGYLVIEPDNTSAREIIYFNSKTVSAVVCPSAALGRGVDGTTATSHASGSTVRMTVTAGYFSALQDGTGLNIDAVAGQPFGTGWVSSALPAVSSVTNNGNRSETITFASTVASLLSPGMRLRTTRTVSAPTQCTDLESGSSQYFSKASPAGMTFTDDFTCMAWVKLESYANMEIMGRTNGTNGWRFSINSSGQLDIRGATAGDDAATSYQSLPLGKWVHVSATMNSSAATSTMYFDGVSVPVLYTNGANSAITQGAGSFYIGALNTPANYFDGKIAQAAVFSSVLADTTIRSYMGQTLSGSESTLVSAYSFNNSLNDLSANANNLTANGGALATATDSPFANATGTPSGTTDVALVMSVTTTDAVVQVTEGCTIPTSGGVSAVAYSTTANPFGWVVDKNKWRIETLLRTNTVTTSNATYGAYNSGGYALVKPVGSFVVGHQHGALVNPTTTAVTFNISPTALTGLTVNTGYDASPFAVKTISSAAAESDNSAHIERPVADTTLQTWVMYTIGATAAASIQGAQAISEIYAIPSGI